MTNEEIIAELDGFAVESDREICHMRADDLLLAALRNNGLADIAEAYERAGERLEFWYA